MVELATKYGRYGYPRITALLQREGWEVYHKRVERLWALFSFVYCLYLFLQQDSFKNLVSNDIIKNIENLLEMFKIYNIRVIIFQIDGYDGNCFTYIYEMGELLYQPNLDASIVCLLNFGNSHFELIIKPDYEQLLRVKEFYNRNIDHNDTSKLIDRCDYPELRIKQPINRIDMIFSVEISTNKITLKKDLINLLVKQEREMRSLRIELLDLQSKLNVLTRHNNTNLNTQYDYSNNSLRNDQLNYS